MLFHWIMQVNPKYKHMYPYKREAGEYFTHIEKVR